MCVGVLGSAHVLFAQAAYNIVADLGNIGGKVPLGGLVRGADDALYGTTSEGGGGNCGIVYRLDPTGPLSLIHDFSEPDGCHPVGELALGPDGSLYGVASGGGLSNPLLPSGAGTIYKIGANGAFTVLYRFDPALLGSPEEYLVPFGPYAGLTLAPDGFFYGTTMSNDIFRISPDGAFALVHQFVPGDPEDLRAALIMAADGYLYSTSQTFQHFSSSRAVGSVFRVSLAGDADVLRRFVVLRAPDGTLHSPEGASPAGELAAGPDGEVYGANRDYGPSYTTDRGTIFRLEPDGTLTVLHAFSEGPGQSYPDGAYPVGGLILGTDGQVYGKTSAGGANGNGTLFRINRDGVFTTLLSFAQDGYTQTKGRLLEASPGVFFGTAGSASGGVVYQVSLSSSLGISLVAPVGGEKLFADVPTTIQWTLTGAVSVDVELSRDGGRTFTPIPECAGLPGSSTSCTWTPTGPPTPKAQIRVVAHDAAGGQASDVTGNIRISMASPRVKIVFPHRGVRLKTGTMQTIWWIHNLGARSVVRIELSRDGGANWEVIAPAAQNVSTHFGAFNWLVTGPATMSASLRVTSLSTDAFDVSHRPFVIVTPGSIQP